MSDDDLLVSRWLIEPEPTEPEFVAMFVALLPSVETELPSSDLNESQWARAGRREQLRSSLDDTQNGRNR